MPSTRLVRLVISLEEVRCVVDINRRERVAFVDPAYTLLYQPWKATKQQLYEVDVLDVQREGGGLRSGVGDDDGPHGVDVALLQAKPGSAPEGFWTRTHGTEFFYEGCFSPSVIL